MKNLHKILVASMVFITFILPVRQAKAQFVIGEVIKLTVTKVIKAIDLKVQRMQNKTIWLQNAQKVIENQMSKTKLTEISGWTEQQRQLYSSYYTELGNIKATIAKYQRIKDITLKQAALVSEYKRAWSLFRQDSHFNPQELNYMQRVYTGILDASVKNLDEIMLVVSPAKTQMTDEQRLELINRASDHLDENYNDLHQFNNQGIQLSLARSKDLSDTQSIKKLYGIN
ncbi:conjugal transfer protein TraI [Mucilaginibacter sp. PPCGB 2223]|uniref:conjugal transfer protein TraI n=1 Tax=Mucilaginibacter sp. PPCGB 2223 TaxID=1886027 RepID=UPI000824B5A2|nr:conjugal transfer protein TraI [Mucilaginibacter sp. PPCGB 2223]OCX54207.1 conjugal transfer protein TraI [Mucilaginibacter sp. PPCGB 2223]